jgi:dynein heavy chain
VQATTLVYHFAMTELLPTPAKSHYLFNLRDFAKVIMGVCLGDKERITSIEVTVRLWTHEVLRVFGDRLISVEDRLTMLTQLRDVVRKVYGLNFDNVFEHLDNNGDKAVNTLDEIRHLMFTDVLAPIGLPKRPYEEILDESKLQKACEEALENYNMMGDKPMDLVLFSFAIEHLLIICRILK